MIFTVLVVSVQPNLRCYEAVFSKIDTYGAVSNRTGTLDAPLLPLAREFLLGCFL